MHQQTVSYSYNCVPQWPG